jgi:hypothetical protein
LSRTTQALAAICLFGVATPVISQEAGRINWKNYEKIRKGMTEKDIEKIFGVPFGQYTSGKISCLVPTASITLQISTNRIPDSLLSSKGAGLSLSHKAWVSNELGVWVFFDDQGRVFATRGYPVTRAIPDSLEWIWSIVGLSRETQQDIWARFTGDDCR